MEFLHLWIDILGIIRFFIAKYDTYKINFWCPSGLGVYKWVVMSFGLKNASVTYQRAMNVIFHELIDKNMKVYIDGVVMKSRNID